MPWCVEVQDPVRALDEDGVLLPGGKVLLEGGLVRDQEARVTQNLVDVVVANYEQIPGAELDDLANFMQGCI